MSNKTTILEGQSFLDKVIENTGSIEECFEMSLINEMSITDNLVVGKLLTISKVSSSNIVSFLKDNKPATKLSNQNIEDFIPKTGIGYMIINNNFIVE